MSLTTIIELAAGVLALSTAAVRSVLFVLKYWRRLTPNMSPATALAGYGTPAAHVRPRSATRHTYSTVVSKGIIPSDISRPPDYQRPWEMHEWRHALAVLNGAYEEEWNDLLAALREFKLLKSAIVSAGAARSPVSRALESSLYARGWREEAFEMAPHIGGAVARVDCFKSGVAVEVHWYGKEMAFDRTLNNFRVLFDLGLIEVGVIVTRCDGLQSIFRETGRYQMAAGTTRIGSLLPKIEAGFAGGCPVLALGASGDLYVKDI
jgi:hypothetical protein